MSFGGLWVMIVAEQSQDAGQREVDTMSVSERTREVGVVFLVAHILATIAVYLVNSTILQALAAATTVIAILAFLISLVTPELPVGWERWQIMGGIVVAVLVNHY